MDSSRCVSLLLWFPSIVAAVGIGGHLSEGCVGERLYQYDISTYTNCIDISKYRPASSVAVNSFNAGQSVFFFSDADCQDEIYSADAPICYTAPDDDVNGIIVAQASS